MSETELMFSKKEVQRAGETLLIQDVEKKDPKAYTHAMKVLSNWRSCHEYPLHKVANDLQGIVKNIDKQAFVVRRLKRTPSIVTKAH